MIPSWVRPPPREGVHLHFSTDVPEALRSLRAARTDVRDPDRTHHGQWVFTGDVLERGIQISARRQGSSAVLEVLSGRLVPAPGGGSDFVGDIGVPLWTWQLLVSSLLLVVAVFVVTLIWVGAALSGKHAIAQRLSFVPRVAPIFVFSFGLNWWVDRRRARVGLQDAHQALKNWITQIADSPTTHPPSTG